MELAAGMYVAQPSWLVNKGRSRSAGAALRDLAYCSSTCQVSTDRNMSFWLCTAYHILWL
jgi:hypothetical protein